MNPVTPESLNSAPPLPPRTNRTSAPSVAEQVQGHEPLGPIASQGQPSASNTADPCPSYTDWLIKEHTRITNQSAQLANLLNTEAPRFIHLDRIVISGYIVLIEESRQLNCKMKEWLALQHPDGTSDR